MYLAKQIAAITFLLLCSEELYAQLPSGTIYGTVTDQTNARIPRVPVTVTNEGTNAQRSVSADETGSFVVTNLPAGTYRVKCALQGFANVVVNHVILEIGERREVVFVMQPATVSESIAVTARAPLLDPSSSSLGQVVHSEAIAELPLNGRNFVQLGTLQPGAIAGSKAYSPASTTTIRGDFSLSVNGMRVNDNDFIYDGVDNNAVNNGSIGSEPSVDGILEFKVLTHNYSAQYGRNGGGTILITTKSGTNSVHGTAYEFIRNTIFDARNFFAASNPAYKQNQFGSSLGGPIKKDKLFFFADYEGERVRQQTPFVSSVPTQAMVSGNFSGVANIFNPLSTLGTTTTRTAFPNNTIPESMISPIAGRILALYPAPNAPGIANNYLSQPSRVYGSNKGDMKVDATLSPKDNLSVGFSIEDAFNDLPAAFQWNNNYESTVNGPRHLTINENHVLSPTTANQFTAGYNRMLAITFGSGQPDTQESQALGIPGANHGDIMSSGLVGLNFTGFSGLGASNSDPKFQVTNVFHFADNLTAIRGRHTLNFGFALRANQLNTQFENTAPGSISFTNLFTAQTSGTSFNSSTGYPLASLLLDLPSSMSISYLVQGTMVGRRWKEYRPYVQDDFKVSSRFTLNLGFAYEHMNPMTEVANRFSNFDPVNGVMQLAGVGGVSKSANVHADWWDLQPRFGFAYSPAKTWAIRGGYGLFNDYYQGGTQGPQQNPPQYIGYSNTSDSVTPLGSLKQGFPGPMPVDPNHPFGTVIYSQNDHYLGRVQQWNFTVEHELPSSILVTAAYVGTMADHLSENQPDIGQPVPGPGTIAARRQFPAVTAVFSKLDRGIMNYNGLQTSIEKRFSPHLSGSFNYTWSHGFGNQSPTNAASVGDAAPGTNYYPFAPQGPRTDYSASYIDLRHSISSSWVYSLPVGRGQKFLGSIGSVANHIIGGWNASVISRIRTGFPFGVSMSSSLLNNGQSNRPNVVCDPNANFAPMVSKWFNTACFAQPAAYQYGNAGRTTGTGPNQVNFDVELGKSFPIREAIRVQFRAEAFNVANTSQFNMPSVSIGVASAGSITSTIHDAREFQLALKLIF